MPTTIVTGRDVTFTIGGTNYDAQALSATLTNEHTIEVYQTLDGRAYKAIDDQWSFDLEILADWGASPSLCESMWTSAETAANTTISVVLTAVSGAQFTFSILPVFPSVGGTAPDAQTVTMSFTVVGVPAESFS